MQDGKLSRELTEALARLQTSFEALGAARDTLGQTLDSALVELTCQINLLDAELNSRRRNIRQRSAVRVRRAA